MRHLVLRRVVHDALELLLDGRYEFTSKAGELGLVVVEGLREIGLGLVGELGVPTHARRRTRSFTSGQGATASGFRRYASTRRSIKGRATVVPNRSGFGVESPADSSEPVLPPGAIGDPTSTPGSEPPDLRRVGMKSTG